MSLTQYLNSDGYNRTPVSQANPLPVTTPDGALALEASVQELITEIQSLSAKFDTANTHLTDIEAASEDTGAVPTYPLPGTPTSGATAAITDTTSTLLLADPGDGFTNYVTAIVISNTHATVDTDVQILDGSGGTVLMTLPAAADYGGCALALPTPLEQPTASTALHCKCVTTGASVKVSAVGFVAAPTS